MKTADKQKEKASDGPRRIYLPKARILSQEELTSLTEKEKTFAKECKDKGVWLELSARMMPVLPKKNGSSFRYSANTRSMIIAFGLISFAPEEFAR